uniref:Peroxin-12 n=1 Tax=Globisporangium ultimum (strain ATCC 200006 / CBS 805.95 / DAOM BR144) TaxID=431595 RepID=K3WL72_GLOUD
MMFLEQTQGFGGGGTAALEGDAQPPSLFELMMQERMAAGIKPALEYLVHTVTESYPQVSSALPVRYFEESYALLRFFMERYFLNRYDSLATEKFYGMKRVMFQAAEHTNQPAKTELLSDRARKQSLIFAVLVPYLKAKLDNYHRSLKETLPRTMPTSRPDARNEASEGVDSGGGNAITTTVKTNLHVFLRRLKQLQLLYRLKKAFLKTYPFAHFAYEGAFFLYQWLYLFGDTPYFSPFLRRMKIILVRVTADDESTFRQHQSEYRDQLLAKLSGSSLVTRVRRFLLRASWMTMDHSYVLLLLGIACYKFLEWMYSEEGVAAKMRMTGTDAPIPPPPLPPQFSGNALMLSTADPSTCPVCRQIRVNPAMSVSGYVFCYPCIYHYVEAHGECPVTQMKCDLPSIVKIYDDARDS